MMISTLGVPPISKITENLYLGSIEGYKNEKLLIKHNIGLVVSFLSIDGVNEFIVKNPIKTPKIKHLIIIVEDAISERDNLRKKLDEYYPIIKKYLDAGKKIFFHCFMGVSRSATGVIYILMRYYCIPYPKAINIVKNRRIIIDPNIGFLSLLSMMEKQRKCVM